MPPQGPVRAAGIHTPYENLPSGAWDAGAPINAPLRLHNATVPRAWLDYNGHMSESCYLLVVGDSADAFFRFLGIDDAYRAGGHSLYTVESHLHHLREVSEGDELDLSLQLVDLDDRRLHLFHTTADRASGKSVSTVEQLLVHVDSAEGRSCPLPVYLRDRLRAVQRAHAALPRPSALGHVMGIRRRTP
jgi:acyl-CoA thioester hydrolase